MTISDRNAQRLLDQIVAVHISAARRDGTLTDWTPPRDPDRQRSSRFTGVFASDYDSSDLMIHAFPIPDDAQNREDLINYTNAIWRDYLRHRSIAFLFAGDLSSMIPTNLPDAIRAVRHLDPQLDADYLTFGDQSRRIWYTTIDARLHSREWRLQHHHLSADLEPAEILGRLNRQNDEYRAVSLIERKHAAILSFWQLLDAASPNVVHFPRSLFVSAVAGDSRRITTAAANDDMTT
jgi:hypothetical protein